MVSKDSDFRHSHLLRGQPSRLLAIVTGNVSNTDLLGLFNTNADRILSTLDESSFVELGATSLVVPENPPIPDQPCGRTGALPTSSGSQPVDQAQITAHLFDPPPRAVT